MRILAKFWYKILFFLIRKIYFRDISIITADKIGGHNLYLCSEQNGVVDGILYEKFIPDIRFLSLSHLGAGFISRMFFCGFKSDDKDTKTDKKNGINAIKLALDNLKEGESVAFFYKGANTTNENHLEFKNSFELMVTEYEKITEKNLKIMVMGANYDNLSMGGKVEIIAKKILENDYETVMAEVLPDFKSKKDNEKANKIATISSLDNKNSHFQALKYCEKNPDLFSDIDEYERMTKGLLKFNGIPIFPIKKYVSWAIAFFTLPFVGCAFFANIVPMFMAYVGANFFVDKKKDIYFSKIIIGTICFIPWVIFVLVFYGIKIFPLYLLFSYLGFRFYGIFKKHIIAVMNLVLEPELREDFINLKKIVDEKID